MGKFFLFLVSLVFFAGLAQADDAPPVADAARVADVACAQGPIEKAFETLRSIEAQQPGLDPVAMAYLRESLEMLCMFDERLRFNAAIRDAQRGPYTGF